MSRLRCFEYQEAVQYSERWFGLGREFVGAVEESLATIAEDPQRNQLVGWDIRILRMRRFPYYLFYHHSMDDDSIIIYAVAHHRRKPDYWSKRLPS